ncbi:biotin/lipoyl-binding protein [Methylocystis sp. IM2]|uniref:efflux RND transporter periplasmic adaptor subunit n=1 Tax=Methylocystis sp. IM2 TaxID=3136563 RepID=UPI0030FABCA6
MNTDLLRISNVKTKLRARPALSAALLLFALFIAYEFYARKRAADLLFKETLENAVPTVSVTYARSGPPRETITLPGNIEAWFQAPIYAQVSGYVKMWYKDYGAHVKKGDVLAEINTPTLDAQYSQAKAAFEAQRAKYNLAVVTAQRWVALRKSHAVSEQSISVQEANEKRRRPTWKRQNTMCTTSTRSCNLKRLWRPTTAW